MRKTLEQRWVSSLDSPTWRRFARSSTGSRLLRNRPARAVDTARRYVLTSVHQVRQPEMFRDVETFCMVIGHVKSGGTLVGSLIDAHPDAILADETDVLRYIAAGFRRDQIFHLLLKGSRRAAAKGRVTARRLDPYDFLVPSGWQGRYRRLRVIGESKAGPTTRRLGQEPDLLPRLRRRLGNVGLKVIHVVRNPFDPISAMVLRGNRSLPDAIREYGDRCETLLRLRARLETEGLLTVSYEDFVRDPVDGLRDICGPLGLDPDPAYLAACAGIVHPAFGRERERVEWSAASIRSVRDLIHRVPFLHGYSDAP